MFLSFYYTEKVALYVKSKNPIFQEIKEKKNKYETKSVNSIIKGNTIIPGLNGIEVNIDKSAEKMNKIGAFNETYLVYKKTKPEISLKNNKDKIIISGNKLKKQVAIIILNNEDIFNYSKNNKIKITSISKINNPILNDIEYLNGEESNSKFKIYEQLLNREKINTHICVINNNYDICKKYHNYLVMPYLKLNKTNIIEVKNNIEKGSIILIKNNARLVDYKILLSKIKSMDLEIVFLSKLISEEN